MSEYDNLPTNIPILVEIAFSLAQSEGDFDTEENYFHEIMENSRLTNNQLSPILALSTIERLLVKTLSNGEYDEVTEKGVFIKLWDSLQSYLESNAASVLYQLLTESSLAKMPVTFTKLISKTLYEKIKSATGEEYNYDFLLRLLKQEYFEHSQNFTGNSNDSLIGSLYCLLLENAFRANIKNMRVDNTSKEFLDKFGRLNLLKPIPTIRYGAVTDDSEGKTTVEIEKQSIEYEDGNLPLPLIYDFSINSYYRLGNIYTLLVSNCKSVGGILYKYIMYVFRGEENTPRLIIGAETNIQFKQEMLKLASKNDETSFPLFLGIFLPGGHRNLGLSTELGSAEKFTEYAHQLVCQYFQIDNKPESLDLDKQREVIEEYLEHIFTHIMNHAYENAYQLLVPLLTWLRGSAYTNHYSRSLLHIGVSCTELMRIGEAHRYLTEGLNLETNRGKPDNVAVLLYELAKLAYVQGDFENAQAYCYRALGIKVSVFPRIVQQGLASHTKYLQSNVEGELYLLALLHFQSNNIEDSKKLLELLRANCERKFYMQMLGNAFDLLGVIAFEEAKYLDGVKFFADSIETKLKAKDYFGVEITLDFLQICYIKHSHQIPLDSLQKRINYIRK